MPFKDALEQFQPIVYQTLHHALSREKLAHAYLFQGPAGTPKKETAYLLAQSMLCEHGNPFGCESCELCQRVQHNQYADMIVVDGNDSSIKKDTILNLQTTFSKTGLEAAGKKFYIIDKVENATPDALNSLLKFLEEPTSDMTAILISEQIDRVLPTIISRCQVIHFKPLNQAYSIQECRKLDMEELDAYFLSQMVHSAEDIQSTLESEAYQHARYCMKEVVTLLPIDIHKVLLFMQSEGFTGKNKILDKKALQFLLDMLVIYYKDMMKTQHSCLDEWYQTMLNKQSLDGEICCQILQILMTTNDTLIRSSLNVALLIDQMIYRIKEVMIHG